MEKSDLSTEAQRKYVYETITLANAFKETHDGAKRTVSELERFVRSCPLELIKPTELIKIREAIYILNDVYTRSRQIDAKNFIFKRFEID